MASVELEYAGESDGICNSCSDCKSQVYSRCSENATKKQIIHLFLFSSQRMPSVLVCPYNSFLPCQGDNRAD